MPTSHKECVSASQVFESRNGCHAYAVCPLWALVFETLEGQQPSVCPWTLGGAGKGRQRPPSLSSCENISLDWTHCCYDQLWQGTSVVSLGLLQRRCGGDTEGRGVPLTPVALLPALGVSILYSKQCLEVLWKWGFNCKV